MAVNVVYDSALFALNPTRQYGDPLTLIIMP